MNPSGAAHWDSGTKTSQTSNKMAQASFGLSEGCIRELYENNRCETKHPCVQLLDYEQSEVNQKEITVRLSDGRHFIDCTLFGSYAISNHTIIQTKNASTLTTYRKCHIIKLIDYFSKIDDTRISKLKIIVRKIAEVTQNNQIIGAPQEIHQYIINSASNKEHIVEPTTKKSKPQREIAVPRQQQEREFNNKQEFINIIKLENGMDVQSSSPTPPPMPPQTMPIAFSQKTIKKQIHPQPQNQPVVSQNQGGINESLTLSQILNGKEGFLIGRLLRFKAAKKQTKESIMTVCYLGLVDRHGQMIRVHLAGRIAMNNQKTLRKNKSYYIRGFDLVNIKNVVTPQIRLKQKQYKIVQVHNEELTKYLPFYYYSWDHQTHQSELESEFVDVIGVIEDIQEKATYSVDTKSVIRVVLKNKFKSVRISFWTDQMKNFENFNLKRKEAIIVEDIRKKQGKYYDFSFESTLIQLNEFPFLQQKFAHLLPQVTQTAPPQNIRQLEQLYNEDPTNGMLQTLRAYLVGFKENKVVYRLCDDCKKKVEREATECYECASQNLVFKYNCPAEFSDSTGSLVAILFDVTAQKLIGKTANQITCMKDQEILHLFQTLFYKFFIITVQNRNQRIILRNIEFLDQNEQAALMKDNLQKIYQENFKEVYL